MKRFMFNGVGLKRGVENGSDRVGRRRHIVLKTASRPFMVFSLSSSLPADGEGLPCVFAPVVSPSRDVEAAFAHDEELAGELALLDQDLAGRETAFGHVWGEAVAILRSQTAHAGGGLPRARRSTIEEPAEHGPREIRRCDVPREGAQKNEPKNAGKDGICGAARAAKRASVVLPPGAK